MSEDSVTRAVEAVSRGEPMASDRLLTLVYDQLRQLAAKKMAQERAEHTLQPTALVHEAYLRLIGDGPHQGWESRGHFYAAAAEAMRRILIEAARRKASLKRGGGRVSVEFTEVVAPGEPISSDALLALDSALEKLEVEDPDVFKLVMLRYFGGLSVEKTALALDVSPRTVKRHWSFARAWLQREITQKASSPRPCPELSRAAAVE